MRMKCRGYSTDYFKWHYNWACPSYLQLKGKNALGESGNSKQ